MNKTIEELKPVLTLALEALENSIPINQNSVLPHNKHVVAITAIKEALASGANEQPAPVAEPHKQQSAERVEPDYSICPTCGGMASDPIVPPEYRKQEPVSDRENSIIRFALYQFMSNAYAHLTAAAQDKEGKHYPSEAVEKFAKDAEDAHALLKRLRFTSPPAGARTEDGCSAASKPWVGLNAEECNSLLFRSEDIADAIARTSAKLREKNEHREKNA